MQIKIQTKGGIPIYTQISNQVKEAILTGQLQQGEALPSIRGLSADLKISVITTKKAYEELEQEGLIYSVPGKGFFVDDPDLDYLAEKRNVTLEEELAGWIAKAKTAGLGKEEVRDMIEILWEDTDD